ncbi:MAG: hypothetical protein JRN52_07205 [Nitrososphaerota archaeon]|nr:hypothetical protein [Nitrososphaerota archaeon]
MGRKSRNPFRLDIVGLNPGTFQACMRNVEALVEARTKGTQSRSAQTSDTKIEDSQSEIYNKIASIAIDFERAYGKTVEIRVFERSSNKLLEAVLKFRGSGKTTAPEFYVNGVRVFKGIPNSFSELDEAIERAFRRS